MLTASYFAFSWFSLLSLPFPLPLPPHHTDTHRHTHTHAHALAHVLSLNLERARARLLHPLPLRSANTQSICCGPAYYVRFALWRRGSLGLLYFFPPLFKHGKVEISPLISYIHKNLTENRETLWTFPPEGLGQRLCRRSLSFR